MGCPDQHSRCQLWGGVEKLQLLLQPQGSQKLLLPWFVTTVLGAWQPCYTSGSFCNRELSLRSVFLPCCSSNSQKTYCLPHTISYGPSTHSRCWGDLNLRWVRLFPNSLKGTVFTMTIALKFTLRFWCTFLMCLQDWSFDTVFIHVHHIHVEGICGYLLGYILLTHGLGDSIKSIFYLTCLNKVQHNQTDEHKLCAKLIPLLASPERRERKAYSSPPLKSAIQAEPVQGEVHVALLRMTWPPL